jgi:hypothetical protein
LRGKHVIDATCEDETILKGLVTNLSTSIVGLRIHFIPYHGCEIHAAMECFIWTCSGCLFTQHLAPGMTFRFFQHEKAVLYFKRALQLNHQYLSAWTLMGHE